MLNIRNLSGVAKLWLRALLEQRCVQPII